MDSSVTPTSPSEMAILVAGLLIMLFGVYKVYRERGRPGLLILWGGLVDLGLALMGLGLGPSGDVGSIMIVIYHAIARLAAWIGLSGLVANPYSCVANDIRGALHRNPVGAVLLAFALEASLGISPAMTPEGQHLVLHAMAMHSIDVPLGGPVLAIIMALGYTVLLWLSAEVVLQVCFTRPDEPICTDVPLGGGGFARALFDQETELLGVPSGSWCPIVPNRWSKTPAAISLYVLLGMLVVLGLGRFFVQDFGAWLIGIDPHTLVELEGPWHVTPLLLYVGSFLVLCPRIIRPAYRAKYTFALFLAAFILIYASDLPPLSRLFSLIISGIGTLVACYSTNYIEEDGRKHWYWFFLLLTFGALLNIALDGKLSLTGVARGRKKGIKQLAEYYAKHVSDEGAARFAVIGNADCPKDADRLKEALSKIDENILFLESSIGPVIGSHVGPGMLAVVFWGKDRREELSVADRIARKVKGN